MKNEAIVQAARREFHRQLFVNLLTLGDGGVPSIADKKNSASIRIAKHLLTKLGKARDQKNSPRNLREMLSRELVRSS